MAFKLTYLDIYGLGEGARMLFTHAKADWIDERIPFAQWPARKATGEFPNGKVPILTHKGKVMNESNAILRYVGKELGYYPEDNWEAWYVDSLLDFLPPYVDKLRPIFFSKNFDEALLAQYRQLITELYAFLEKHLKSHGKDFLIGDKITIADFVYTSVTLSTVLNDNFVGGETFIAEGKKILAEHPHFFAYIERMRNELKAYLETRPAAGF